MTTRVRQQPELAVGDHEFPCRGNRGSGEKARMVKLSLFMVSGRVQVSILVHDKDRPTTTTPGGMPISGVEQISIRIVQSTVPDRYARQTPTVLV